jgi:hypothetical protein
MHASDMAEVLIFLHFWMVLSGDIRHCICRGSHILFSNPQNDAPTLFRDSEHIEGVCALSADRPKSRQD